MVQGHLCYHYTNPDYGQSLGKQDSNLHLTVLETGARPIELFPNGCRSWVSIPVCQRRPLYRRMSVPTLTTGEGCCHRCSEVEYRRLMSKTLPYAGDGRDGF